MDFWLPVHRHHRSAWKLSRKLYVSVWFWFVYFNKFIHLGVSVLSMPVHCLQLCWPRGTATSSSTAARRQTEMSSGSSRAERWRKNFLRKTSGWMGNSCICLAWKRWCWESTAAGVRNRCCHRSISCLKMRNQVRFCFCCWVVFLYHFLSFHQWKEPISAHLSELRLVSLFPGIIQEVNTHFVVVFVDSLFRCWAKSYNCSFNCEWNGTEQYTEARVGLGKDW